MIPEKIFLAMIKRRALTQGKDDRSFYVNYKIIQEEFPSYLEFLVKRDLNPVELAAYLEGYMIYTVLDNGLLEWRSTGKRYKG